MNNERFSHIAHSGMTYHNPLAPKTIHKVLDLLKLDESSRVLEVGSGPGELLCQLAQRYHCKDIVGVDPSERSNQIAEERIAKRQLTGQITLVKKKIEDHPIKKSSQDCVIAVGASHALGDYRGLLEAAKAWVKPGGLLLVGEGYWKQSPAKGYLEFLGCPESAYKSFAGTIEMAGDFGWQELFSSVTNQEDWDEYEGRYLYNIEQHVHNYPEEDEANLYLEKIRRWRRGYLTWGRETLGFSLHLFRKRRETDD